MADLSEYVNKKGDRQIMLDSEVLNL